MADLYAASYYSTYNNAGSGTLKAGDNNKKLLGDGASGVGPYTRFGTRRLQAVKIVSAALNETTTPAAQASTMQKIVDSLQMFGEVYYVGVPASDFVTALVAFDTLNAGGQGADAYGGTADATSIDASPSFESVETAMSLALGQAVTDVTITAVTLTGGTFA